MRKIAACLLLALASFTITAPVYAQKPPLNPEARAAQKRSKKMQKQGNKRMKAQRKAQKKQQKDRMKRVRNGQ